MSLLPYKNAVEPFIIYKYPSSDLKSIVKICLNSNDGTTTCKSHFEYFEGYFEKLRVKSILVENDYIDKDYLEDFAGYYVRCFKPYEKKCFRLHFFSTAFSDSDFKSLLAGEQSSLYIDQSGKDEKSFNGSYLGFIVLKPLPQTFFGRTCLKTYPENNGERFFPCVREYHINLFGIPLTVKSLAFQEQDRVVAACATSALWSVFHGTGILFQHAIPSPVEITKTASESNNCGRMFPSSGLTSDQMSRVIQRIGLDSQYISLNSKDGFEDDEFRFKSAVYSYLKGKIPIVMGMNLYDISDINNKVLIGKHAVAITGYSLQKSSPGKEPDFRASRVDKIYVHDDHIGPFARMPIQRGSVRNNKKEEIARFYLQTTWEGKQKDRVIAVPECLIIPIYSKIRIAHDEITKFINILNGFIKLILDNSILDSPIEWDISLTTVNDFKHAFYENKDIPGELKQRVLTENFPKFLWRVTAYSNDKPVIDLLFDATDISQGNFLCCLIEYGYSIQETLRKEKQKIVALPNFEKNELQIFEWIINSRNLCA